MSRSWSRLHSSQCLFCACGLHGYDFRKLMNKYIVSDKIIPVHIRASGFVVAAAQLAVPVVRSEFTLRILKCTP